MVGSSIIAAWTDISNAMIAKVGSATVDPTTGLELPLVGSTGSLLSNINVGYLWMACNCMFSAAYVLARRKRIKVTGFKDWDSMFYNNLLCIPVLIIASVLIEDWGVENLELNL
jgi:GDP-mannose transporter